MKGKEDKIDFVKWFSELSNKDVGIAGGKGASLSEMYNAKIPVPPGFVVTAQSYAYFIRSTGIDKRILALLDGLDIQDTAKLNEASRSIRQLIESAELPKELEEEIVESYNILDVEKDELSESSGEDGPFVAVRSSATTEDLADASFAGQQESFLNVKGKSKLLEKVKACMSSLFTARAIYYRTKKGFPHDKSYLAVVVQKMVNSKKSGVMFSQNPTSNDKSIVIEAVWGLGEGIVSGQIKPDHYVVDSNLDDFKITQTEISDKKIAFIKNEDGKNEVIKLNSEVAMRQVLDTYEIKRLAQYGRMLEEHYHKPQDIEFAIDKSGIFIVQSRPITTIFKDSHEEVEGDEILSGLGASPGISSGVVKIVHELSELEKVKEGDVLVTEMTNPDMVVSMQKSAAIVTDEGGVTSHAAIVSREMGIPAVVGTGDATKKLKDGDIITVDGNNGKVYAGKGETKLVKVEPIVPTRTEIKVIVDLPQFAERAAKSKVKAVGLVRLEGIIASGGKHPKKFVDEKKMGDYEKLIADGIEKIAAPFEEVWVRTSDIRSDEYRNLEGAPKHVEGNPMLGDHGVRFSLKHPDIMKAEISGIRRVAQAHPNKKFGIMMPQVISASEVRDTKKIEHSVGMLPNMFIGIMVETPAAVQIIEELCKEGIKFISFGTNDLTQFTLAIDRNNEEVQAIYNEMHPAVLRSIGQVIQTCKKYNVKTSICGQAGSRPEMVTFLIKEGISSISVNADAAKKVSELVARLENEIGYVEPSSEINEAIEEQEPVIVPQPRQAHKINKDFEIEKDIEETILEELEKDEKNDKNEYFPGDANGKNSADVPPLNEAIPVGSEMFGDFSSIEESDVEEELVKESEKELVTEWKGERKPR